LFYDEIVKELDAYSAEDAEKDKKGYENLVALAVKEADNENNYQNFLNKKKRAADRVAIVKKIREYELAGRFDEDVEDDPPSKVLNPEDRLFQAQSHKETLNQDCIRPGQEAGQKAYKGKEAHHKGNARHREFQELKQRSRHHLQPLQRI
jgi:hypothetical protein